MWCALALVLLLDASGSVDARAWDMQVQAHADALADPAIGRAMQAGGLTAVSVVAFDTEARVMVPWRLVDLAQDARGVAREVAGIDRPGNGSTQTGAALAFALRHLWQAPCEPERQVVDIVTDGRGDDPARLAQAREAAIAAEVRVNVLTVETYPGAAAADWAREHLVTPGGFVMEAAGWAEFAAALRRKIASEVASLFP
jgi:Mg-chelatase subunit ChlD